MNESPGLIKKDSRVHSLYFYYGRTQGEIVSHLQPPKEAPQQELAKRAPVLRLLKFRTMGNIFMLL